MEHFADVLGEKIGEPAAELRGLVGVVELIEEGWLFVGGRGGESIINEPAERGGDVAAGKADDLAQAVPDEGIGGTLLEALIGEMIGLRPRSRILRTWAIDHARIPLASFFAVSGLKLRRALHRCNH